MSFTPFLTHTAWLCLAFGTIFVSVCPRVDALLSSNLRTLESQLMTRHFGIAMLLVGSLCLAIGGAGSGADDDGAKSIGENALSLMLIVWHAAVVAAFVVEFRWIGAFDTAPVVTRMLARGGALAHVFVLVEGLLLGISSSSSKKLWGDDGDNEIAPRDDVDDNNNNNNFSDLLRSILRFAMVARDEAFPDGKSSSIRITATISTVLCSVITVICLILQMKRIRQRKLGLAVGNDLSGELVVITGAAGGIGRELSLAFARRGMRLALWDNREEALDETRRWLESRGVDLSSGNNVRTSVVDVSDANAVAAAAESLRKSEWARGGDGGGDGAPRVVVSNAAVMRGKTLLESSDDEIQLDFSVNVLAGFWVFRAFLRQKIMLDDDDDDGENRPRIVDGKRGKKEMVLVTMGSIMAELPAARQAEYCASKAALSQLHECLRWELKKADAQRPEGAAPRTNIRPLLIQPYAVKTDMISGAALLGEGTAAADRRFALIRRVLPPLEPSDVARRVVEAVQCGEERVYIPRIVGLLPLILNLLPNSLSDGVLGLCGAFDGTDGFSGCAPAR